MEFVYGLHAVESLLRDNPRRALRLYLQAGRDDARAARLLSLAGERGIGVARCPRRELDRRVAGRHQGAVLEVRAAPPPGDERSLFRMLDSLERPALLLALDGVTDPHNLGACLRSADAAGAHALIAPRDRAADITPAARKVACGAADSVLFVRVANLARALRGLRERGVWLYGTAASAPRSVFDADLASPCALVVGAEGRGLRRLTRECCDDLVGLPMAGAVASLNVSVAAGVCLYEAVRQRAAHPGRP